MPEVALLPCPFCGRQPKMSDRLATDYEPSRSGHMFFVVCCCDGEEPRVQQRAGTYDEVQKLWNTRVTDATSEMGNIVLFERMQELARYLETSGLPLAAEWSTAVRWALISVNGIGDRQYEEILKRFYRENE